MDDSLAIWLNDYHSTHGTAVGYGSQSQREVHKNETWILAYAPSVRNPFGDMTIHAGTLAIKIQFPNHDSEYPRYVDNLRAFVKKCREASDKSKRQLPGVEGLGLESKPTTQAATEAPTPGERLTYFIGEKIGEGAFGHVNMAIKARDGKVVAAKTFNPPYNKSKRRRDEPVPNWLIQIRKEFTLMRDNPHVRAEP